VGLAVASASLAAAALVTTAREARAQDSEREAHAEAEVTVRGDAAADWTSHSDERDSARELTDAASLIEPLPGVHVRRFGADDSFATLSIRGSSSSEVAVILAGVPLTGGADPTLDLSTLPLWPGAVARVHRSFAPAELGPGSLGGTLVLEPPRPTAPEATDVWAAVGSFGEARTRVGNVSDVGGGARVATAFSASRSTDDFTYVAPFGSAPASAGSNGTTATLENAGHAAANALASLALPVRWGAASAGALTVTVLAQARHQELPGTVLGPTPFAHLDSDRELASAELTGPLGPGAWGLRGWGRREGTHLGDVPGSASLGPTYAAQAITAAGGSFGWRGRASPGANIDTRVDASAERYDPGLYVGTAAPPGASRASVGGAVDAEWRPVERLVLAGSARLDAWSDAASDGTHDSELRPTGHVGVEVPLDWLTIATHAGATARPPSFTERYGDRGAFIGDPSLQPESAWTVDAGARGSRRLGAVHAGFELVGFATWADDLITFVPTGAYGKAKATNIGRARLAGIEADARVAVGAVEVRAAYTGLLTANEGDAACTMVVGRCQRPPLPGRPQHDLLADAVQHFGPASVRVGVDAVTGIVTDLSGSTEVPPRVFVSAGARLDVTRGVRLAVDVRNLFDVRTGTYQGLTGPVREPVGDSYDYPLPGRSVLFSARFSEPGLVSP
jgi:outer membrane cobalamin receptor